MLGEGSDLAPPVIVTFFFPGPTEAQSSDLGRVGFGGAAQHPGGVSARELSDAIGEHPLHILGLIHDYPISRVDSRSARIHACD